MHSPLSIKGTSRFEETSQSIFEKTSQNVEEEMWVGMGKAFKKSSLFIQILWGFIVYSQDISAWCIGRFGIDDFNIFGSIFWIQG